VGAHAFSMATAAPGRNESNKRYLARIDLSALQEPRPAAVHPDPRSPANPVVCHPIQTGAVPPRGSAGHAQVVSNWDADIPPLEPGRRRRHGGIGHGPADNHHRSHRRRPRVGTGVHVGRVARPTTVVSRSASRRSRIRIRRHVLVGWPPVAVAVAVTVEWRRRIGNILLSLLGRVLALQDRNPLPVLPGYLAGCRSDGTRSARRGGSPTEKSHGSRPGSTVPVGTTAGSAGDDVSVSRDFGFEPAAMSGIGVAVSTGSTTPVPGTSTRLSTGVAVGVSVPVATSATGEAADTPESGHAVPATGSAPVRQPRDGPRTRRCGHLTRSCPRPTRTALGVRHNRLHRVKDNRHGQAYRSQQHGRAPRRQPSSQYCLNAVCLLSGRSTSLPLGDAYQTIRYAGRSNALRTVTLAWRYTAGITIDRRQQLLGPAPLPAVRILHGPPA